MRVSQVLAMISAAALLAACGSGGGAVDDDGHIQACQQQHDMARNGLVPSGEIAISCPAHGIGYAYQ